MNVESDIRRLARSSYWQILYHNSKDAGFSLFINKDNLSGVQSLFLYWLQTYSLLFEDLQKQEYPNLTEKVLDDDIRCDAFLYWRNKQIKKQILEYKKQERLQNSKLKSKDNAFTFDIDMKG